MDNLDEKLRSDAELIDPPYSEELHQRITASLQGIRPESQEGPAIQRRPAAFWWASSLSGVAAALIIIAVLNTGSPVDEAPPSVPGSGAIAMVDTPIIDWKAESAMLTSPLRQELLDLQSDLKKAEEKVKQDIGL